LLEENKEERKTKRRKTKRTQLDSQLDSALDSAHAGEGDGNAGILGVRSCGRKGG
jgi:hypothetical protein